MLVAHLRHQHFTDVNSCDSVPEPRSLPATLCPTQQRHSGTSPWFL